MLLPVRDEVARIEDPPARPCSPPSTTARTGPSWWSSTTARATAPPTSYAAWPARDVRVRLVTGRPLPPGWLGKPHACDAARRAGRPGAARSLVFVDADVRLAPQAVRVGRGTVAAQRFRPDLPLPAASWPSRRPSDWCSPSCNGRGSPHLPLRRAERSTRPSLSAGNGQFLVVDRAAYQRAGGHAAVKDQVLDDIALVRAVKAAGGAGGMVDGTDLATCRMYDGWGELRDGYAKSLWSAFGSPAGAVGANSRCSASPMSSHPWPRCAPAVAGRAGRLRGGGRRPRCSSRDAPAQRVWPDVLAHPLSIGTLSGLTARSWRLHRARPPVLEGSRAAVSRGGRPRLAARGPGRRRRRGHGRPGRRGPAGHPRPSGHRLRAVRRRRRQARLVRPGRLRLRHRAVPAHPARPSTATSSSRPAPPLEHEVDLVPVDPVVSLPVRRRHRARPAQRLSRRCDCGARRCVRRRAPAPDWAPLMDRAGQMWDVTRGPFLESPLDGVRGLLRESRKVSDLRTIAPWKSLRRLGEELPVRDRTCACSWTATRPTPGPTRVARRPPWRRCRTSSRRSARGTSAGGLRQLGSGPASAGAGPQGHGAHRVPGERDRARRRTGQRSRDSPTAAGCPRTSWSRTSTRAASTPISLHRRRVGARWRGLRRSTAVPVRLRADARPARPHARARPSHRALPGGVRRRVRLGLRIGTASGPAPGRAGPGDLHRRARRPGAAAGRRPRGAGSSWSTHPGTRRATRRPASTGTHPESQLATPIASWT